MNPRVPPSISPRDRKLKRCMKFRGAAGEGGMMELQWGGVRRERRVSMFFAEKFAVLFARARSGGTTSNNKPTRGRWEEGCRLHVSPGRSRLPTRLRAWEGDSVDGSGKTSSCVCGLNSVAQPGVSNKKFRQRSGTPRGRRHATTSRNQLIPARKGE
jgi:hypothetical protein